MKRGGPSTRVRGWRRRLARFGALAVGALASATLGVTVTRAVTDDGLTRARAADCANTVEYVRHAPLEMEACIARAVRSQMRREGVLPALVALQHDANRSPLLKAECHLALHELGREQLRGGLRIAELNSPLRRDANWNSSCVGGFLHGYLQALAEEGSRRQVLTVARTWCVTMGDQNRAGCAHAVGHGLSRSEGNDLVAAASGCRSLPESLHRDCLAGAVMELNFADRRLEGRMRADDGLGPASEITCGSLARDQRTWCRALVVKGELLVTGLSTVA